MIFSRYCVLSVEPLVLTAMGVYDWRQGKLVADPLPPLPAGVTPVAILEQVAYFQGWTETMLAHLERQRAFAARGIEHHLIVNSAAEERVRVACGVRGAFVNGSIFVDGWTFAPEARERDLDAVYIGRLIPLKRHDLARDVERLMVIGFGEDLRARCPALGHAEYNRRWLTPAEVARHVNRAHAGLCLSAEEGYMRASLQYLLCGVPVVTTPSRGGRDEFYDTENSLVVDAEPGAVTRAVKHWKDHPPDRRRIRRRALARQAWFRRRYCRHVADVIRRHGAGDADAARLYRSYFGSRESLRRFQAPADVAAAAGLPSAAPPPARDLLAAARRSIERKRQTRGAPGGGGRCAS